MQFSGFHPLFAALLGQGTCTSTYKNAERSCCIFCCHLLYPSSLTSCHVACQTSQPAPCSPSSFPFVCCAFLLSFPWVLFQTFSPFPAASAGSQVSHTHVVCRSWAMLTWGMLSEVQICIASHGMHPRATSPPPSSSSSAHISLLGLPELFVPLRDTPVLQRSIPGFMCAWQDYINCL